MTGEYMLSHRINSWVGRITNRKAEEITEDGVLSQAYVLLSTDNKAPTALHAFVSIQDSEFHETKTSAVERWDPVTDNPSQIT